MAKIDWKDAEGTVATVHKVQGEDYSAYTVVFTYKVDGHWCSGTFTSSQEYRVGDSIQVRYDPHDPDRNDLSDKDDRKQWMIWAAFAVSFLLYLLIKFL